MVNCTISECLNTYFSQASAILYRLEKFRNRCRHVAKGDSFLFQLTAASLPTHSENATGKSIVRPEAVNTIDVRHPETIFRLNQDTIMSMAKGKR